MTRNNHPFQGAAPGPTDWVRAAYEIALQNKRCVLVFVTEHKGSTPRETGAWVLISEDQCLGTLGGGEVERTAIAEAHDLLAARKKWQRTDDSFQLGPDLGQCCGGFMSALLEPIDESAIAWLEEALSVETEGYVFFPLTSRSDTPQVINDCLPDNLGETIGVHIQPLLDPRPRIVLYGGGHVGKAIAVIATQMPVRLEVVDERLDILAEIPCSNNIKISHRDNSPSHARELTDADAVLIMTHSHGLDYRLCHMLLGNTDISYIGLIGSETKSARFRSGFLKEGFHTDAIDQITCPIGAAGPNGKEPGIIAIAALNEIMQTLESTDARTNKSTNTFKQIK